MHFGIGDVIRFWDDEIRRPDYKRHIVVCPDRQLSLRINSNPIFPPYTKIVARNCDFLKWDSYIELQSLKRHHQIYIQKAELIGRLSNKNAQDIMNAVNGCNTLPDDTKTYICERLSKI